MNIMRKLVFLVVMLGVVALSVGCQQLGLSSGLSEEEVRSIVREEVASQLAGEQVRDVVEEEVTRQLASVDKLMLSELYIENTDGKVIGVFGASADGDGLLNLLNADGKVVVQFGSQATGGGMMSLYNADGECVAFLNQGILNLYNCDGKSAASLGSDADGNATLFLYNSYGKAVAFIGAPSGDGVLVISDKNGQTKFSAP